MRMIAHGVTDDIRNLVEAAVIDLDHGVEDSSLYRLEAVLDVGDCPVLDDIGCVLDEVLTEKVFCVCHVCLLTPDFP